MNAQTTSVDRSGITGIITVFMMTDLHCGSYTHVILNQNFAPNGPDYIGANADIQPAASAKWLKKNFFLRTRTT